MAEEHYDRDFPDLRKAGFQRTSEPHYHNCIAYAAGDFERKWWPSDHPPMSRDYWPSGMRTDDESVEVFIEAFAGLGYRPCPDGSWERGFEKVAFYAWRGAVQHAARQQVDGTWRSKLGVEEDIVHSLAGLEGPCFGRVVAFVRRPIAEYQRTRTFGARLNNLLSGLFRRQ